ncbi:hypothetical protein N6G02_13050 [Cupriavidus gilardii]|uniref:hypothetical protein n=1 Tax=Cupriavidus gilardii TaxID=82541 RepID=UPI0021C112F3|nr:hypothetical protein [Cupriavidus gilardii]MCT9117059.1 hypothetical protein [Cupriavidus gilardii]
MVLMRDAVAAAACRCCRLGRCRIVAARPMSAKSGREWKKSRRAGGRCALLGIPQGVNPAKASDRLDKVRDLTKEPQAAPRSRWQFRPWRPWRRLALAVAGLAAALPCGAGPTIVALADGRQFGAAGDLAYVLDMPLDAPMGSRWQVCAPSGANPEDVRPGPATPRQPHDTPARNLGTVELVSPPRAPGGMAIVTVVSSVREVTPGSVLVPLPAAQPEVE